VRSLGRPASHGCIRLDTANAANLYALVKEVGPANTRIVVVN
jgi:lipoprotein-anchoring transpeptidase ErfK/SrfK